LFLRSDGGCVSGAGFAVYEFLNGDASYEMNDGRIESLMVYMGRFHEALRQVAVPATVTDNSNPWKKADSLDYILSAFERDIADSKVCDSTRSISRETLDFLRDEREGLEKLPIQLIHGDIGPGNILYAGDSVVSVIDFTPMSGRGFMHCVTFC
jgi:Ser/Thr protein kinase RdoA (MazF antagonist)